jgi:hypothetical protein
VTVAATSLKIIGNFPRAIFNNGAGVVKLICSSVTTVKVGAYKTVQAP